MDRPPTSDCRDQFSVFGGHGLFTYLLNWTSTDYAIFGVLRSALLYNNAVLATPTSCISIYIN